MDPHPAGRGRAERVTQESPCHILFSQMYCNIKFTDDRFSCEGTIEQIVRSTRRSISAGHGNVLILPWHDAIKVVKDDGCLRTLDNRRLFCSQYATKVLAMRYKKDPDIFTVEVQNCRLNRMRRKDPH